MMKGGLGNLMRQAQQMQETMKKAQSELVNIEVMTPARQRLQDEQDKVTRAATAFDQDPAVRGLRERFGATVDPASVKPGS